MKNFILIFIAFIFFTVQSYKSYSQNMPGSQFNATVGTADVLIYPNPVTEDNFSVKSDEVIKTIEILNVIGQSVKKITNETGVAYNIIVKMPDCDRGMYMVRITFIDNKSMIKKVLFK